MAVSIWTTSSYFPFISILQSIRFLNSTKVVYSSDMISRRLTDIKEKG